MIWQTRVYIVYYVWNIADGAVYPPPANVWEMVDEQVHQGLAVTILNLVTLWCVKFALLALFRKMGHNVRGQGLLWWSVLLFTVATLAISIGVQAYGCVFGDIEVISGKVTSHLEGSKLNRFPAKCAQPKEAQYVRAILRVQAAVDVVSDAFSELKATIDHHGSSNLMHDL